MRDAPTLWFAMMLAGGTLSCTGDESARRIESNPRAEQPTLDAGAATESSDGLVLAYGEELQPPYHFTGIGTRVVSLNGHQFCPLPSHVDASPGVNVTEESAAMTRARVAILNEAYLRTQSIGNESERREAVADILRRSTSISSVDVSHSEDLLYVEWIGFANEAISISTIPEMVSSANRPRSPRPSAPTLEALNEFQQGQMELFWNAIRGGGFVAFGEEYFVSGGGPDLAKRSRDALQQLAVQATIDKEQLKGTILEEEKVLASVISRLRREGHDIRE